MGQPQGTQADAVAATQGAKHSAQRPGNKRNSTSYVAKNVRGRLEDEAARPEWDLRRLIGNANTLDYLTERLADPRRKQKKLAALGLGAIGEENKASGSTEGETTSGESSSDSSTASTPE